MLSKCLLAAALIPALVGAQQETQSRAHFSVSR